MADRDIRNLTRSIEKLGGSFGKVAKKGMGLIRIFETLGDMAEITASIMNVASVKSIATLGSSLDRTTLNAVVFHNQMAEAAGEMGLIIPAATTATRSVTALGASMGPVIIVVGALLATFVALAAGILVVKTAFSIVKKAVEISIAVFKKLISIGAEVVKGFFNKIAEAATYLKDKLVDLIRSGVTKLIDELRNLSPAIEGVTHDFILLTEKGIGALATLEILRGASSRMISDLPLMQQYSKTVIGLGDAFALLEEGVGPVEILSGALQMIGALSLATGESVEYFLNSFVKGIQKLSPLILDNLHIQVSLAEASAQAAFMFGKSADELTRAEKQAGMTVVVMNKLALATKGLPGPMGTLAQKIKEIESRFKNFKDTLMMIFLPAAKAVADLILAIMDRIEGSGKALRYVSAVITVIAEELINLVNIGADAADRFKTGFVDKLISTASAALEWGAKIAVNLAIGIIEGGGSALIAAMNWISNLLAKWLSPGSAPLVAPMLGAWGASAFTEWLRGFTNADFAVLEGIQAPLLRALKIVTGDGEFGDTFEEITEAMAAYLAGSSDLESVLASLTSVGGAYGDELATLFQRMLSVADATSAVEAAEKRLADAQNRAKVNRTELIDGAREYNKLLRGGADQATLKAKLEQLKTNYKNMKAAEKQVEEEEKNVDIAKEHLKVMKDMARAQERLLNQILKLAEIKPQPGDGEPGDGVFPGLPELPILPEITTIDEAFDAIYDLVRARLEEIWAMMVQTWEESEVGRIFTEFKEAWKTFLADIKTFWEESGLKDIWDEFVFDIKEEGFKSALADLWGNMSKWIQTWLDSHDSWWADVWRVFTQKGIEDGTGDVDFAGALTVLWSKTKKMIEQWTFDLGFYLGEKTSAIILNWAQQLAYWISGITVDKEGESLATRFLDGFSTGLLFGLITRVSEWSGGFSGMLATLFNVGGTVMITASTAGVRLAEAISGGVTAKQELLSSTLRNVVTIALGAVNAWERGKELISSLWSGMVTKINEINWASMGQTLKSRFVSGLSGIGNALKGILNTTIGAFEGMINNAIYGLNLLIWAINNIPGVSANYLGYITLPRLDTGGMVTATEQLALLHGQEVVLPLGDPRTTKALSDAMRLAQVPGTGQDITINNYFGPGSVRSNRDIEEIANEQQRILELRGVRGRL